MSGAEAATLFAVSKGVETIGTISAIQSQRAALARENYRIAAESKMAALKALEAENARKEEALKEVAQNKAFASTAGYYDDSMSFLNINKQVANNMNKDVANIRLMGKQVQNKFGSMLFENQLKSKDIVFGGYTSVISDLTSSYIKYKEYKKYGVKMKDLV